MSHSPQSRDQYPRAPSNKPGPPNPYAHSAPEARPDYSPANHERPPHVAAALPSLASLTGAAEQIHGGPPSTWRSTGIHSILNPPSGHPKANAQTSAPNGGSHGGPVQHYPSQGYASPRGRKRSESSSPRTDVDTQAGPRSGRKIISPRSPGLRAASLGGHRSPSISSVMSNRIPVRSMDGRAYPSEHEDQREEVIPPAPSMTPSHSALPAMHAGRDPGHGPRHPTNIPAGQYPANSSQGPSLVTSGGGAPPLGNPNSTPPTYPQTHLAGGHGPPPAVKAEMQNNLPPFQPSSMGQGLPHHPSGWKMAIDTLQGRELLDVNIDYQQASKMADEKRKRNAGASARFRARRKEKEKEASQMISGLQQELRELAEERDFYINERNFFRDVVTRNNPGPLPSRPVSPQSRKPRPGPMMSSNESSHNTSYSRRDSEDSSTQRRRTDDYQASFGTAPPTSNSYNAVYASHPPPPPPGQSYGYSAPPSGQYSDPRGVMPGAPPSAPPAASSGGPQPPSMGPARPQPLDPFRRDVLDRGWNPGRP